MCMEERTRMNTDKEVVKVEDPKIKNLGSKKSQEM
jgi:hypothetical protein